jgi:hypothetical protein
MEKVLFIIIKEYQLYISAHRINALLGFAIALYAAVILVHYIYYRVPFEQMLHAIKRRGCNDQAPI